MRACVHTLLISSLLVHLTESGKEDCTDIYNNKDSRGWTLLEKLNGQVITIFDKKFNSTFTIGICTNLLPDDFSQYAAALEETSDNQTIVVGRYNESELMTGSHWIMLKYMKGDPYEGACSNSTRHAAIMITCNHRAETLDKARIIEENLGREKNCYHLFEVEHCIACISDGCSLFFHGFSPGTIMLIGFASLIVIYLLVGWIYARCIRRRRGIRQFPNVAFWQEIGHLQAEGCNMVCRCGKRPEDGYSLISGSSSSRNQPRGDLLSDDEILLPP